MKNVLTLDDAREISRLFIADTSNCFEAANDSGKSTYDWLTITADANGSQTIEMRISTRHPLLHTIVYCTSSYPRRSGSLSWHFDMTGYPEALTHVQIGSFIDGRDATTMYPFVTQWRHVKRAEVTVHVHATIKCDRASIDFLTTHSDGLKTRCKRYFGHHFDVEDVYAIICYDVFFSLDSGRVTLSNVTFD